MESNSLSEVVFTTRVQTVLEKIYEKHKLSPIKIETRRRLSSISEDLAFETLRQVFNKDKIVSLDGIIQYLIVNIPAVNSSPRLSLYESPVTAPRTPIKICRAFQGEVSPLDYEYRSPKLLKRDENGSSNYIAPQLVALGELEFKKTFLLLSYIGGKPLVEAISDDEIRQWKGLSISEYESAVWFRLGQYHCPPKERQMKMLEEDSDQTHYYQCQVAPDGSYRFKGYHLENTGTHLHKVVGDDNVLTVRFDQVLGEETYCNDLYATYKGIAKNGIMVGLRRYQFFVFKDGGKEEKKKDAASKGVKCYFIRTDSTASYDMGNRYIFSGKSIHEARMHFMHVNTLPSLANYMSRFSLILSKTTTLEVDMAGITFEQIDDIHCHDQDNNDVLDKNGKPYIHSDGTGYISEDLARMCPNNIFKGKTKSDNIQSKIPNSEVQEPCGEEPPLLIQFRMFYNGYAVKGTFLLNKKLPPRTVQVRPSMIKVYEDPTLSNFSTFNSLEVVATSNRPKTARLSRNLIALLSYGGVPDEFFLNILKESQTVSYSERAVAKGAKKAVKGVKKAVKAAINYGDLDDQTTTQMIMAGIPLDEPYLKSVLLNTEKNALKSGKLPITESYYLMGTMDPTGKLKENEVSVILEYGQISGDVLVYRNPGLHFGDVHVLKATYVEALTDYVGNSKYAVFFSQKGPRSVGDEIASGDFDGDMYFISRNPKLLEHFKPSEPWVKSSKPSKLYSGRKPSELSPEELEEELFKMFLKARFCKRDVVGMAADCWLGIMDPLLSSGDQSTKEKDERIKKMLKLIDIYYDAIDAPKKGAKVDLPLDLKIDNFPHYMERSGKSHFKSTTILGKIFDTVVNHKSSDISKLWCFEDERIPESCIKKIISWYERYKDEMKEALKETDENKKKHITNEIVQRYKQEFCGGKTQEELKLHALALYNIVYNYAMQEGVGKCGFVWKVAGPILCSIYLEKTQEKPIICSTSMLKKLLG